MLSASEESTEEEDVTTWRAGDGDGDDGEGELDARVAGAFDALNLAMTKNNEVEAAHAAALQKLEAKRAEGKGLRAHSARPSCGTRRGYGISGRPRLGPDLAITCSCLLPAPVGDCSS